MKFVRGCLESCLENGFVARMTLPALCAVAGAGMFAVLVREFQTAQLATMALFGLVIACLLRIMGLFNQVAFFGFGLAVILNPRKYFGIPVSTGGMSLSHGQAAYQFLSLLDLTVIVLAALLAFNQLGGEGVRRRGPILPKLTKTGLIGFAAVALYSCTYALSIDRALAQIVFDCKLTLMLVVLSCVFSDRERIREYLPTLVYGLLAGCVVEMLICMVEYAGFLRTSRNLLGIPVGNGAQEELAGGASMFRIAGTYGHSNYLGAAMAALGLLIWELQIAVNPILQWRRTVCWAIWAGVVFTFLLAFSRGAWLAMAASAAFYLPFAVKIQGRAWLNAFLKRYAFISVLGAVVMIVILWRPLERRLFHSDPNSIQSRVEINEASTNYVAENPFFGGGIGNHVLLTENDPYIKAVTRFRKVQVPAHNIYLFLTTEVGFVGTFLYLLLPLGIFLSAVYRCLKYPKDPVAPICFAFANTIMIFWISDCFSPLTRQIGCSYLYWMLMGVAAGTLRPLGENEPVPVPVTLVR